MNNRCASGCVDDNDEDRCGVCGGTQAIECHQCGGSGRVQEFNTKEVSKMELQPNAEGEEEGKAGLLWSNIEHHI